LTAAFRSLGSLLPLALAAVLVLTASPRAQDLGIPDTEASLTPEMLAEEA